jgi:hypothetical protein
VIKVVPRSVGGLREMPAAPIHHCCIDLYDVRLRSLVDEIVLAFNLRVVTNDMSRGLVRLNWNTIEESSIIEVPPVVGFQFWVMLKQFELVSEVSEIMMKPWKKEKSFDKVPSVNLFVVPPK